MTVIMNLKGIIIITINDIQDIKVKELHDELLPKLMELFERRAATNGTDWIWGNKVSEIM